MGARSRPDRSLDEDLARIGPLDRSAMDACQARLDGLTKPPGSLGRLEELACWLAGVSGRVDARIDRPIVIVAAADHGVAARGVSAYPAEVTRQMVATFEADGAAINSLARWAGAGVTILDVGVRGRPLASPRARGAPGASVIRARVRDGTADLTVGPAMRRSEALDAVDAGRSVVRRAIRDGADVIAVGEMGIGNTTAASALTAVLADVAVDEVTGSGTGIDDDARRRKVRLIEEAIAVNRVDPGDPIGVLAALGGLEIAALVGIIVGAASEGVPVVLDGFITGAAALVAIRLRPAIAPRLVAAHRSVEPGHAVVLDRLALRPLLELDLRLGEGTGAALAIGLLTAAVRIRDEMATFAAAGVSGPTVGSATGARPVGGAT